MKVAEGRKVVDREILQDNDNQYRSMDSFFRDKDRLSVHDISLSLNLR